MNDVPDGSIHDVLVYEEYSKRIYKLYRAGILQVVVESYSCDSCSTVKRCEVAAIITRMMKGN